MTEDQLKNDLDAGQSIGESLLNYLTEDDSDTASLDQWLRDHPEARGVYELLMDPARRAAELQESRRLGQQMSKGLDRFLEETNPLPRIQPAQRAIRKPVYYLSGAVAALLIAVSTLILLKHTSSSRSTTSAVSSKTRDIAPGGNKAILTLSNGQTITLDSASNGLLAQQGKVHVLKSAQGQIDYQGEKSPSSEIVYNTMTTPKGGTFKLTLADGTKVWLNAGSSLRYPVAFAGLGRREVDLTGEAYFEVAPDKSSAFEVHVATTSIKVLGTHFDVMAYTDERQMETTLLEGAVEVSHGNDAKILRPDQQARISTTTKGDEISVVNVDPEDYIAWKNGLIQMHDADIPTVMRQISRWYDVTVEYQGNHIPSIELEGRVARTLTLSEVLKVLNLNGIHCKVDGRTITVLL